MLTYYCKFKINLLKMIVLEGIKHIEDKIKEALDLRFAQTGKSNELGIEILNESKKYEYIKGINYGKLIIAVTNFLRAKDEHVIEYLLDALEYFESIDPETGYVINLDFLGSYYDITGQYDKSIDYLNKGLNIAREIANKEGEADILGSLGKIYSRLHDFDKAIDCHTKSLEIRKTNELVFAQASSLNLLARSYSLKGDYEKAEDYYKESIFLRLKIKDYSSLAWSYLGLASLYEKIQKFDMAQEYYYESLKINQKNKDKQLIFHNNLGLGNVFFHKNDMLKAEKYTKSLIGLANEIDSKPLLSQAYKAVSEVYERKGNYTEAYKSYIQYHKLKEEVLNSETQNKIAQQQAEFEIINAKKEAEIYQLRNVELKNAFDVIETKNNEIVASIQYAKHIQNAILPRQHFIQKFLPDSFILFKPRDIVSGDFYWLAERNGKVFVSAVDCTGHGVPGAMLSMIGSNFLNQAVNEKGLISPDKILYFLDESISNSLHQINDESGIRDGMDLAVCAIDYKNNKIEYAGAFNPLYLIKNGELLKTKGDKNAIGGKVIGQEKTYTLHTFDIEKNDCIYIFSDGYADQFGGPKLKKFMQKQLQELLISIYMKDLDEQKQILDETFLNWKGESNQIDDVLLIGVKF